jgi:hypothetical protein
MTAANYLVPIARPAQAKAHAELDRALSEHMMPAAPTGSASGKLCRVVFVYHRNSVRQPGENFLFCAFH